MEKSMTNREFLNLVINANVSDAVTAYAQAEIAKLDAKNDKRRNTLTKEQQANAELQEGILEILADGSAVASEIATKLGVSTQKASALLQLLVKSGKVTVADLKIKGKGSVKSYTLAE